MTRTYDAIAFDLLTALVDSWSLWISVAGDEARGRAWRQASLRIVTKAGRYRPYEGIVAEATAATGLPPAKAEELLTRWRELKPWPETPDVVARLAGRRLAILTNCSQRCADIAAQATGGRFELVMSAEKAGIYKTAPESYRALLAALALPADRVLFVAGSPHDVPGAQAVGMDVYWSNRLAQPLPKGARPPLIDAPDLTALPVLIPGDDP
ncbi:MAG: HAD-IA family hydrolase [Alphaproteobacteria bacterium]|nr:HAD-IA family hydrolase [Alphaproteobacteria bacterium]